MIVILLGWLALANFLSSLPSRGLQIYLLLIVHASAKLCCAERNGISFSILSILAVNIQI